MSAAHGKRNVELAELIDASACAKQYAALEECMGEADRVWSKCQPEVSALRKYNSAQLSAQAAAGDKDDDEE